MELRVLGGYPLADSCTFEMHQEWHHITIIRDGKLPGTSTCCRLTNGLLFCNLDMPSTESKGQKEEDEVVNLINCQLKFGDPGWILYKKDVPDPYFPWDEEFNDEWMQELKKCFNGIE